MPDAVAIEPTSADVVFALYERIPEFSDSLTHVSGAEIERRLGRPGALALLARVEDEPAAFKLGYDRYGDGSWYSWLGGTLPEYRNRGVAEALLRHQEVWVREAGFQRLYVKTRNRFTAMRGLLDGSGYQVVAVECPEHDTALIDLRILMVKLL